MKKQILLLVFVFAFSMFANAQQQQKGKTYFIKSGYLKTKITGNTVGTSEMWWDDYGKKTCTVEKSVTTVKVFGFKKVTENNTLTIHDNGQIWTVDYVENTATKTYYPNYNGKPVSEMNDKEREQMQEEIFTTLGIERLPNEKFMGYNCDVYKGLGTKAWSYKNIGLKSESKILGLKRNTVAEVFKPNTPVDASKFVPPSDVEYQEVGQPYDAADVMSGRVLVDSLQQARDDVEEAKDDVDDNKNRVATKYPYEQFVAKCNAFRYGGYIKYIASRNEDGDLLAMYRKGLLMKYIMVAVTDKQNVKYSEATGYTTVKHNGKEYMYHVGEGKEPAMLGQSVSTIVYENKKYNSVIAIVISPVKSKEEMLKMADSLGL